MPLSDSGAPPSASLAADVHMEYSVTAPLNALWQLEFPQRCQPSQKNAVAQCYTGVVAAPTSSGSSVCYNLAQRTSRSLQRRQSTSFPPPSNNISRICEDSPTCLTQRHCVERLDRGNGVIQWFVVEFSSTGVGMEMDGTPLVVGANYDVGTNITSQYDFSTARLRQCVVVNDPLSCSNTTSPSDGLNCTLPYLFPSEPKLTFQPPSNSSNGNSRSFLLLLIIPALVVVGVALVVARCRYGPPAPEESSWSERIFHYLLPSCLGRMRRRAFKPTSLSTLASQQNLTPTTSTSRTRMSRYWWWNRSKHANPALSTSSDQPLFSEGEAQSLSNIAIVSSPTTLHLRDESPHPIERASFSSRSAALAPRPMSPLVDPREPEASVADVAVAASPAPSHRSPRRVDSWSEDDPHTRVGSPALTSESSSGSDTEEDPTERARARWARIRRARSPAGTISSTTQSTQLAPPREKSPAWTSTHHQSYPPLSASPMSSSSTLELVVNPTTLQPPPPTYTVQV
ncbi:hypothetical protein BJ742DRAFT_775749 [Cladochytrium replicatum]|nr:hypothetical protein BJ742DRAFT_775749 [Cladochytrium replicatum]